MEKKCLTNGARFKSESHDNMFQMRIEHPRRIALTEEQGVELANKLHDVMEAFFATHYEAAEKAAKEAGEAPLFDVKDELAQLDAEYRELGYCKVPEPLQIRRRRLQEVISKGNDYASYISRQVNRLRNPPAGTYFRDMRVTEMDLEDRGLGWLAGHAREHRELVRSRT